MAGKDRERGKRECLERIDRFGEGVRDEPLRALLEFLVGDLPDVVAGREHPVGAGDDHAARGRLLLGSARARLRAGRGPQPAGREPGQRGGDRVEDAVVERVALFGVGDRQAHDPLGRLVEKQLATGQLSRGAPGGGVGLGGHRPDRLLVPGWMRA